MFRRILIVGMGSMGARHLRLARERFPHAEIRVLLHQKKNYESVFADSSMTTKEEAIQFAPEIAIIANPAPFHVSIAQSLAEIGTHLLIEKPLSTSSDGVFKLIETCNTNKAILMTGYNLRYSPTLQYFKERLSEGIIGTILSIRSEVGQYLPTWRPERDYRVGVSARKDLGGGVLFELSHEIDYLRWIFGEIDWVRATLTRQSSLELNVEDSAHLTIGFSPKMNGSQIIGTLNMDFIRHDQTRVCTAVGSKGSLRWDGITGEVFVFEEAAMSWKKLFAHESLRDETYRAEWQEFIDCTSNHGIPSTSAEDGLRVLEVIEAARLSANTGAQVPVSNNRQKPIAKI
jgi:predicted dehydrogenase